MAISFPRSLLAGYDFEECTFSPVDSVSFSRTQSNRVISRINYADTFWTAVFRTEPLDRLQRAAWRAWGQSLRGGLKTFLSYDLTQPEPLAYPDGVPNVLLGSPAWNYQAAISSMTAHGLVLTGVPSGYQAKAGDYVGLVKDGRYGLTMIVEDAVAGGTLTLEVSPAIPLTVFDNTSTVVLRRPLLEFIVPSETFQCPGVGDLANVSFEATQRI